MGLKTIIFDFDGVILESVNIKTVAFQHLFADYPDQLEQITHLHLENGGMSRFKKFEIIYRDFLQKPLSSAESERLGDAFSAIVFDEILQCSFVPGALPFLKKYSQQYPLFVASGTPQPELREIVARRGLAKYFNGVYGTPRSKSAIIQTILDEHSWQSDQALLIGDSINDYQAAQETEINFVGRQLPDQTSPFPPDVSVVADLIALDKQWTAL